MDYLYYYTSIETLAYILKNKAIRFSSLVVVDDIEESKVSDIKEMGICCFVSCWTHCKEESLPLWNMYTPDMRGVRICLPKNCFEMTYNINDIFNDNMKRKSLFDIPEPPFPYPEKIEIVYTEDDNLIIPKVLNENKINGNILGKYKHSKRSQI